ncbi:MAG: winged helix-turn-helix domain-containing protein [Kofleriaceae bacterium]
MRPSFARTPTGSRPNKSGPAPAFGEEPAVLAIVVDGLPRALEPRTVCIASKFSKSLRRSTKRSPPRVPRLRGDEYQALLDAEPNLSRASLARRLGISRPAVTQALRRRGPAR